LAQYLSRYLNDCQDAELRDSNPDLCSAGDRIFISLIMARVAHSAPYSRLGSRLSGSVQAGSALLAGLPWRYCTAVNCNANGNHGSAMPAMICLRRRSVLELAFFVLSRLHDLFIPGAIALGVEQHEVAARGAFDPDGKGQIAAAPLLRGQIASVGGKVAIDQERGKGAYAERLGRAAHGAGLQAKVLKRLSDLCRKTLSPPHWLLYLHPARAKRALLPRPVQLFALGSAWDRR
jgi:hypothetical protein